MEEKKCLHTIIKEEIEVVAPRLDKIAVNLASSMPKEILPDFAQRTNDLALQFLKLFDGEQDTFVQVVTMNILLQNRLTGILKKISGTCHELRNKEVSESTVH